MISLIIPAFNEEACVVSTLSTLRDFLHKNYSESEIILVDDGSQDGTARIARDWMEKQSGTCKIRLIQNKDHRGKGFCIRKGMQAAQSEFRIFMDADLPYRLSVINEMQEKLQKGVQVTIGNRNDPRSLLPQIRPIRLITGRIYSLFVQIFATHGISDTQCGVKGFSSQAAELIFSRATIDGFGFDVEALFIAQKHGLKIEKLPVEMPNNREDSRVRLLRDSFQMFLNLFTIRLNDLRGIYN